MNAKFVIFSNIKCVFERRGSYMYIRNAMPNEAERIMEIIDSAKSSLRALGIDQWQDGYPNLESTK